MNLKTRFLFIIASAALMLFVASSVRAQSQAQNNAYIRVQERMYNRVEKIEEYLNRTITKIDELQLVEAELKNKAKQKISTHFSWLTAQKQAIADASNQEELRAIIQSIREDWIKKRSVVHLYVSLLHLENVKRFLGRVENHYERLVEKLGENNENVRLVKQHLDEANEALKTASAAILELDPETDGENMIASGRQLLKPVYEEIRLAIQSAKAAVDDLTEVPSRNAAN